MAAFVPARSAEVGKRLCHALGISPVGMEKLAIVCEISQPVRVYIKQFANLPLSAEDELVRIVADFVIDDQGNVVVT
jgi:hypothetical protein